MSLSSSLSLSRQGGPHISQDSDVLSRLKQETSVEHRALESALPLASLDLTKDAYLGILERFYGFYLPWESAMRNQLHSFVPELASRCSKVPLLLADLNALGRDPVRIALCRYVPEYGNAARILGGMYVSEGATLGGQLIARHIERTLEYAGGHAYSFFQGYGAGTANMWREFRDVVRAYSSPANDDQMVSSAKETFRALREWLLRERSW